MTELLPPIRLTGATILRDGALRQRSVAIVQGRIGKGPLPAVDLTGYLILPGIIDLLFLPPVQGDPAARLRDCAGIAARAGITTAWVAPRWSWSESNEPPAAAEALLDALRRRSLPDLRPALRVESSRSESTEALVTLCRSHRPELVYLENRAEELEERRRQNPQALAEAACELGLSVPALAALLDQAGKTRRERPRHLCRLAECFESIKARYGSIGDPCGATREMHSMIGASLAACPGAISAAAAARAMGDPVLLPAAQESRLRDLLRSRLGDALVSAGAPERLLPLALDLSGPALIDLPKLWPLLAERPAEIMHLADRGRLDLGCRADMIIVSRQTGQLEGTISAGRLIHRSSEICGRFAQAGINGRGPMPMAAE